jgi:SAM-dependent methyltransferase
VRNLLHETAQPYERLHGRCRFACDFAAAAGLEGRAVLDIGCGFGWFALYALRDGAVRVVGVEPDEGDLTAARAGVTDPRAEFLTASALALPFDAAAFDMVCCWDVIEHLPQRSEPRFFAEVARVLRPGGQLCLSTPLRSLRATALDPAWWLIGHQHYSTDTIRRLGTAAGLNCVETVAQGGSWQLLNLWNLYLCKWLLRRPPLARDWLDRREDGEIGRPGFMTLFARFVM